MKSTIGRIAILAIAVFLGACAGNTIKQDPAALKGDYSGKDFSGAVAFVRVPGDIPGVPESKGKFARWSSTEVAQALYLDADCQKQLFEQLPKWAQAIVEEGGFSALAVAVGQAGFAAAFPGAEVVRYFLGGLGYGATVGVNTARYRHDSSEKGSQGYCVTVNVWEVRNRYPGTLEGINAVPWYGNGKVELPKAVNKPTDPKLSHVNGGQRPPLR